MWMRFADTLRCPLCKGRLALTAFESAAVDFAPQVRERASKCGALDGRFGQYIEAGLLLCQRCRTAFPIIDGLPILLCYTTPMHGTFVERYPTALATRAAYRFPEREPARGERTVMRSFSKEWLDYDYDGVIWEMSYDD